MPICLYCGNRAKTEEHVIASRLVQVLKEDPRGLRVPTVAKRSYRFGGPIIDRRMGRPGGTRSKSTIEITVPVCKKCNNEWMNNIDTAAFPYLSKMMRGQPVELDLPGQARVAAWMAKLAVSSRLAHLPYGDMRTPAPVSRAWADWLYEKHTAPLHWNVWVTRYDGSEPVVYSGTDIRINDPRGLTLVEHGLYATLVLGYLAVQLFGVDEPLSLPIEVERGSSRLLRIAPAQANSISWPPADAYRDDTLPYLLDRLAAPAPPPPEYKPVAVP
jgi:hypothetical protein